MGNYCTTPQSNTPRVNPPQQRYFQQSPTLKFRSIADNYSSLEQVQEALRREGLESCNLIIAVDFTKSNEWTGKSSFQGRSLHWIGDIPNPYEEAISIIGKTLEAFDEDSLIPAYGFGDVTSKDNRVFSFLPNDQPLKGLDTVVWRYRELVPYIKLAGPTSFAPAINHACKLVADSGMQYHILIIVADGQVTRSSDLEPNMLSVQEHNTIEAIKAASQYPLSIVTVGVGDGPWDVMKEFDDKIPERAFDNFQFVNYTELNQRYQGDQKKKEAMFALRALMEVPEQYKAIQSLGLLGRQIPRKPASIALTPPGPPSVCCQEAVSSVPIPPYAAPVGPPPDLMFICPITQEVMSDPVIAPDGNCYERSAIEQWLATHDTSPMTNQRLPAKNLIPNHQLRSAIMEWRQRQT